MCKSQRNYENAWCFDGEPTHGVVTIFSVGTQNSKVLEECRAAVEKQTPKKPKKFERCEKPENL